MNDVLGAASPMVTGQVDIKCTYGIEGIAVTTHDYTRTDAIEMDMSDALTHYKDRFYAQPGQIYLDGNSLGLLSKDAEQAVLHALQDWKQHGVHGWTAASEPWFHMPEKLGALTAPLVGAKPNEVVVTGSTTVNLHALLATFFQPNRHRNRILIDAENFPSDQYAAASQLQVHGLPEDHLIRVEADGKGWVDEATVMKQMSSDVQLVLLPSVWYKSGQLADMRRLTATAHERGILIGFDLAHSIGALPHALHDWDVDFAVWCNYKYLNGGPGATGGLFVHERHHHMTPGLAGWFGSDKNKQFDMAFPMDAAHTAGQWQISTPPILATVAIGASLRMFQEVGIDKLREKSLKMTSFLRHLLESRILPSYGGTILTPTEDHRRGGHIAFLHERATQIAKALRAHGVTPDFRPPNVIRLAPIPLYTSYTDIWDAIEILRGIFENKTYETFTSMRDTVS